MNELDLAANFEAFRRAPPARPAPISAAPMLTCPKCASTTFARAPASTPFVHGHAVNNAHSFPANPPSIQCTGCGSYWNETDLIGAGFFDQQKRHSAAAA